MSCHQVAASLDITGRRLLASASLQKALGGDWRAAETTEWFVGYNPRHCAECRWCCRSAAGC